MWCYLVLGGGCGVGVGGDWEWKGRPEDNTSILFKGHPGVLAFGIYINRNTSSCARYLDDGLDHLFV
ncbi:hypothetical protein CEXT_550621 [Caerostris extrusa]|uniref:Uncharacterized protein n=1 Tax=Caerostris extrusa TaxID=172846 RepID=A0AAV4YBR9_CAEEX|nr:hypothetical protein CEXT_550621 [Caerostris extrusa]